VQINAPVRQPRILVISDDTVETDVQSPSFRAGLMSQDYGDVQVNTLASDYDVDLAPFDIIVALGNQDTGALLLEAYNAGKSIFAFRTGAQYFFNALTGGTSWAGSSLSLYTEGTLLRTNWFTNPSLETDATDWGAIGTGGTFTRLTAGGYVGTARGQVVATAGQVQAGIYCSQPTARGLPPLTGPLVGSMTAAVASGTLDAYIQTRVYYSDASNDNSVTNLITLTTTPQRFSSEPVTPNLAKTVTSVQVFIRARSGVTTAFTMYGDASMLETASVAGEYFDGAVTDTYEYQYRWTGTVNNSRSEQLTSMAEPIAAEVINDPRTVGWPPFAPVAGTGTYKAPANTVPNIFGVAYHPGSTTNYAITSGENTVGGKFVAVHFPVTPYQHANTEFRLFLKAATDWLNPVVPLAHWEVQVGEFMIDRISEPHFPHEVKITGRDYTKKCMLSKFAQATSFAAGHSLESVIAAISTGAGITKKLLPATGVVIGREFFFERNTTRWEAMKEICTAYNYEIYFDPTGYLTIRPFRDPSTTAPVIYIETGPDGTAASYEKSTSDASLFNYILVSGENSDADTPLVWAEAKNEDANSPTSIQELGERYWEFVSAFVETEEQAQELADGYLGVHQLEEYELSWESLLLPWLEVGEIMGWIDPNPAPDDPTTFLLSSLNIPLNLGPMSGTGRRVIIAGG
jgi:hypothetical protein